MLAARAQKKIPDACAQLAIKASLRLFCTRFCRITARLGPGDMAPMMQTPIRVNQEIKFIIALHENKQDLNSHIRNKIACRNPDFK